MRTTIHLLLDSHGHWIINTGQRFWSLPSVSPRLEAGKNIINTNAGQEINFFLRIPPCPTLGPTLRLSPLMWLLQSVCLCFFPPHCMACGILIPGPGVSGVWTGIQPIPYPTFHSLCNGRVESLTSGLSENIPRTLTSCFKPLVLFMAKDSYFLLMSVFQGEFVSF